MDECGTNAVCQKRGKFEDIVDDVHPQGDCFRLGRGKVWKNSQFVRPENGTLPPCLLGQCATRIPPTRPLTYRASL